MLQVIDNQWKDHLLSMDHLKEGIGLRGYGQKDPLVEYKKESFELFQAMMDRIEDETVRYLFFLQPYIETGGTRRPLVPHPEMMDEEDRRRRARRCASNGANGHGTAPGRGITGPPRTRSRTSRATSSGRKRKSWRSCRCRRRRIVTGQRARDCRSEGGPQRSLSLRQRKEVQEMSRLLIWATAALRASALS